MKPTPGPREDAISPERTRELFWNDLRFISAINVLGLPGAVVPVTLHEGQPIGVQLIAGRYREDLALDAAAAIEKRRAAGAPIVGEDGVSEPRAADPSRKSAKTASASLTVKDATFGLLRAFGIKRVFGNPGSTELPFLSDWPDDIDYVLGLQEASVVGMADGYAQATRNAGFVNLHSGAGVGNALGNIYTAHRNQTPLVITAGQQARSILPLQAFLYAERASEFPRPYVKYSVEPARPEDVPAAIARAYYVAMQPPCGPTFVSIPIDDWTRPAQPIEARRVSRELGPDPEAMKALAAALAASKRPALVVGPGVDRAARRRSDGAGRGEGEGRGMGQPVLGALLVPGTSSAVFRLPARLAGTAIGCAARS